MQAGDAMDLELLESLTEYGVLGMWTVSLLWRDVSLTKRLNLQQEKFQDQLDKLDSKADEKEHALRDRYDQVIADQNEQREKLVADVITRLERIEDVSKDSADKVSEGLQAMRERYAEERALARLKNQ
jgi:ABC-type transporter Mla subunit MlaD